MMDSDTIEIEAIGPDTLDVGDYRATDAFFGRAYIDRDELRTTPSRHRLVHGGFAGTDTRFTFYFPPAEGYKGRLMQPMEGAHAGHENIFGEGPVAEISGGLAMAFRLGGYMVESNCGHIGDDIDSRGGDDPTLYGYRAAIEAARLSKHLAAQIYGASPANGYVYGGSGGGRRSPGCIEYGPDVYTGALPYHSGGNIEPHGTTSRVRSEQPVHFGLMFNVQRLLGERIQTVVDAMQPGGSGDPFAGLSLHEREELANLYRLGFPRGDEFMISQPFGQIWLWTSIADMLLEDDADYFANFWSKPGYLGHDAPQFVAADTLNVTATVKRVLTARMLKEDSDFADPAIQAAAYPAMFIAMLNHTMDLPMAVELDGVEGGYRRGAGVYVRTGSAAGRRLYAMAEARNIFFLDGRGDANLLRLTGVEPGDEIQVDNRAFLAFCYYYRHHISDDPVCDFLRVDGRPIHPQHPVPLASPLMGVPYCGQYEGKLMWIHATHDSSLWPPQGLTYKRAVEQVRGTEGAAAQFCIRWTENAEHTPPTMVPPQPNRSGANWLINFQGIVEQSLVDLIDWVEKGTVPVGTRFDFADGKVSLPPSAAERGGIQPVATVSANGGARTDARVGEPVTLEVTAEVPPGAGSVVAVEWDFDGKGSYPFWHEVSGNDRIVRLSTQHSFDRPGTYFPSARVTAHRDGDVEAKLRRIENVASARVVVR
jgi:hypothetical protein